MASPSRPSTLLGRRTVTFRSSCNACTDVKMACSKDKPTCARCARRDEPCVYAPAKRAGRPRREKPHQPQQQSRPQDSADIDSVPSFTRQHIAGSTSPPSSWWAGSHSSHSQGVPVSTPTTTDHHEITSMNYPKSMDAFSIDHLGFLDGNLDPVLDAMDIMPLHSPTAVAAFDPLSLIHLSPGDPADSTETSNPSSRSSQYGNMTNTSCETDWLTTIDFNPHGDFVSMEGLENLHMPLADAPMDYEPPCSPSHSAESTNCVTRALELLRTLTPHARACAKSTSNRNGQSDGDFDCPMLPNDQLPAFQKIMSQNQASIDTLNSILRCPCSRDATVLHVSFLVIFQILAWYAGAAGLTSLGACFPLGQQDKLPLVRSPVEGQLPGYDLDDEGNRDRIACQIVLSKIHSVRRLVDTLLQQLPTNDSKPSPFTSHRSLSLPSLARSPSCVPSSHRLGSGTSRAADRLAVILEDDLRNCLRELSRAVVARLTDG